MLVKLCTDAPLCSVSCASEQKQNTYMHFHLIASKTTNQIISLAELLYSSFHFLLDFDGKFQRLKTRLLGMPPLWA